LKYYKYYLDEDGDIWKSNGKGDYWVIEKLEEQTTFQDAGQNTLKDLQRRWKLKKISEKQAFIEIL